LAETADLETKATFGQLRQGLGPVIQQAHRELRPAGQRLAQG
jgi:hypothetical protein